MRGGSLNHILRDSRRGFVLYVCFRVCIFLVSIRNGIAYFSACTGGIPPTQTRTPSSRTTPVGCVELHINFHAMCGWTRDSVVSMCECLLFAQGSSQTSGLVRYDIGNMRESIADLYAFIENNTLILTTRLQVYYGSDGRAASQTQKHIPRQISLDEEHHHTHTYTAPNYSLSHTLLILG